MTAVAAPSSAQLHRSALDHIRQRLGNRYTIERELGRGGMGVVYLARDIQLDRLVALKVLPQEFAVQPTLRDRFLRETKTAASFSHPNIVPVYAVEETDDLLAYAMGYIEGESLVERVKRTGPLSVREIVKLMQDVGYALAYAHGRNVVHRDIKPDNIMLDRASGRALVMDFGIARALSAKSTVDSGLTRVGEVVGTPEYMSPEQATGDDVDGRSDLYSLGLTIFFAALGKTAVTGDSTQRVLAKQLTETLEPIRLSRPDLPEALANAIDLTVRKEPSERFESAAAMVDALDVAQLATPEIPLSIRMFAQEAGTLSMVIAGITLIIYILYRFQVRATDSDDMLLVIILLIVVIGTRIAQTFGEAQRLSLHGFSPGDVIRGLTRVVDEREGRRSELRRDPATAAARRKTVVVAIILLAGAALAFRGAYIFRHRVSAGYYQVEPVGFVLILACIMMLGVGVVQLLKSPLRMPVGERMFRLFWLGFPGRMFVTLAGRKTRRKNLQSSSGTGLGAIPSRPSPSPSPGQSATSTPASPAANDRISALETRVSTLEQKLNAVE